MREFEKRRFPDLSQAAYLNFRRCRQGGSEKVREYWLRFSDYAGLVGVKAEQSFINGVTSKQIRDAPIEPLMAPIDPLMAPIHPSEALIHPM